MRLVLFALMFAASMAERDVSEHHYHMPQAAERKFVGVKRSRLSPLMEKKNRFFSLFRSSTPEPPLAVRFPAWKVHKYQGIELRPVQLVDSDQFFAKLPEPSGAGVLVAPPQPETVQFSAEYNFPEYDYDVRAPISEAVKFRTVQPSPYHSDKVGTLLSLIRSHKNLLGKLKTWKHDARRPVTPQQIFPTLHYTFTVPQLAEVPKIAVKDQDNPHPEVADLSPIVVSQYSAPLPYAVLNLGSSADSPLVADLPPPTQNFRPHVPAPYYGPPPLYDSYGTPLPADAYSAPSDQVPTYAVPENPEMGQAAEDRGRHSSNREDSPLGNGLSGKEDIAQPQPSEFSSPEEPVEQKEPEE